MAAVDRYVGSAGPIDWSVFGTFDTNFRWEYQDGRESLLKLYQKGKDRQWDATTRIDWPQDLDPENPEELSDESIPIFGSSVFERLTSEEKSQQRRHFQSWQLSQFLHGEQGALICTASRTGNRGRPGDDPVQEGSHLAVSRCPQTRRK